MLTHLPRRLVAGLLILGASVALAACSGDEDGTSTPAPTATTTTTSTAPPASATPDDGEYRPASTEVCGEIFQALEAAFPDLTPVEDTTQFSAGGGVLRGQGCRFLVRGTSEELTDFVTVEQTLRATLQAAGFEEDSGLAADGPGGTQSGWHRDGTVAILSAGVEPAAGVTCPSDQPLAECLATLPEEQVLVHGSVVLATHE